MSRLKPMATLRTQKELAKMNPNLNLENAKTGEQLGMSLELTTEHCLWHHSVLVKKGTNPNQNLDQSWNALQHSGTNWGHATTKIKDTIAATLDNTRKKLATTKEELAYMREELIQTRKMHEESEEQNRSLRENMNKLITSQKELIDDAEDSTNKLQAKNIELRKMVTLTEELKEEITELKAPKKIHIIMDSNRESIFRSLKEKLQDYAISKWDNIYTTDKHVQQMKTYKPEKKQRLSSWWELMICVPENMTNASTTFRNSQK